MRRVLARVEIFAVLANLSRDVAGDARKRRRQELRDGRLRRLLQHRHQPAQLDAVRMRLNLLRLRRQFVGRTRIVASRCLPDRCNAA